MVDPRADDPHYDPHAVQGHNPMLPPEMQYGHGGPGGEHYGGGPPPEHFDEGPPPEHFEEGPPPEHFDEGPPMEEHYEEGNADEGGEY